MNLFLSAVVIAAIVAVSACRPANTPPTPLPAAPPMTTTSTYDEFTGQTTVATTTGVLQSATECVGVRLKQTCLGRTHSPADDPRPSFAVVVAPAGANLAHVIATPVNARDTLYLLIDDRRVEQRVEAWSDESYKARVYWGRFDVAELRDMAAANKLRGRIGATEFEFTADAKAGIIAFVETLRRPPQNGR